MSTEFIKLPHTTLIPKTPHNKNAWEEDVFTLAQDLSKELFQKELATDSSLSPTNTQDPELMEISYVVSNLVGNIIYRKSFSKLLSKGFDY